MIKHFLAFYCCLAFLVSCNGQKTIKTDEVNEPSSISSEKIKVFLREENFDLLASADVVVIYDIKKALIEGTTDEYSNKVFLKDTLEKKNVEKLVALLKNDSSYDWTFKESKTDFNATRQFLVKNNTKRIFLLVDEKTMKMGFINLEGQKVVKISNRLSTYLKNL